MTTKSLSLSATLIQIESTAVIPGPEFGSSLSSWGSRDWDAAAVGAALSVKGTYLLQAQEDAALVGFLLMRDSGDFIDIFYVLTSPLCRRKGVGRALMRAAHEIAQQSSAARIILEVRASNVGAIALYENLDFHVIMTRPRYYADQEDALVMVHQLA